MRFHILGLPHTVTSKEFNACAYTQKVVKFGKMMTRRGHEVIHYGHEDSVLECTEHVSVLTNEDFQMEIITGEKTSSSLIPMITHIKHSIRML